MQGKLNRDWWLHECEWEKCLLAISYQTTPRHLSGSETDPNLSDLFSLAKTVPLPRVALVAGDVVEVKVYYTPQFNETQTVFPDGRIALQLIGEVEVQGKTSAELRGELLKLYAPLLQNNPEIAIIIQSFRERRVFVAGQVTGLCSYL